MDSCERWRCPRQGYPPRRLSRLSTSFCPLSPLLPRSRGVEQCIETWGWDPLGENRDQDRSTATRESFFEACGVWPLVRARDVAELSLLARGSRRRMMMAKSSSMGSQQPSHACLRST